jgi:hypothetical protein
MDGAHPAVGVRHHLPSAVAPSYVRDQHRSDRAGLSTRVASVEMGRDMRPIRAQAASQGGIAPEFRFTGESIGCMLCQGAARREATRTERRRNCGSRRSSVGGRAQAGQANQGGTRAPTWARSRSRDSRCWAGQGRRRGRLAGTGGRQGRMGRDRRAHGWQGRAVAGSARNR